MNLKKAIQRIEFIRGLYQTTNRPEYINCTDITDILLALNAPNEEKKDYGPSPAMDLVALFKEIERQKFEAENKCARILTTRMVSRFNAYVAEHGENDQIRLLRIWMFGEDNR